MGIPPNPASELRHSPSLHRWAHSTVPALWQLWAWFATSTGPDRAWFVTGAGSGLWPASFSPCCPAGAPSRWSKSRRGIIFVPSCVCSWEQSVRLAAGGKQDFEQTQFQGALWLIVSKAVRASQFQFQLLHCAHLNPQWQVVWVCAPCIDSPWTVRQGCCVPLDCYVVTQKPFLHSEIVVKQERLSVFLWSHMSPGLSIFNNFALSSIEDTTYYNYWLSTVVNSDCDLEWCRFFQILGLCDSSSKNRLVLRNRCGGVEALEFEVIGCFILWAIFCLFSTSSVCFSLKVFQLCSKSLSSCFAPNNILSSYWYWSNKCYCST